MHLIILKKLLNIQFQKFICFSVMKNFEKISKIAASFNAKMVIVSKMQTNDKIELIFSKGQRIFAENKPQELVKKYNQLSNKIEWHLIGHLQKNKVKFLTPFVHMIQSVDSFELASVIHKHVSQNNRKIDILLQIKLSDEETKHGFIPHILMDSLQSDPWKELTSLRICGVMGIGSLNSDINSKRREFKNLFNYFNDIKLNYFKEADFFKEISMGMSDDYTIALEEGSTMIRIGSAVFSDL